MPDGQSGAEPVGSFCSIPEACAEVRAHLLKHHTRDWYDSYEVVDAEDEDEDCEDYTIEAECPEGESMRVYIAKTRMPQELAKLLQAAPPAQSSSTISQPATQPDRKAVAQATASTATAAAPVQSRRRKVWILIKETQEHHTDDETRDEVIPYSAYDTLKGANDAAFDFLLNDICGEGEDGGSDSEDEFGSSLPYDNDEENRGSETLPYKGTVYHLDDTYSLGVRVESLHVQYAPPSRKRAVPSSESDVSISDVKRQKTATVQPRMVIDLTTSP